MPKGIYKHNKHSEETKQKMRKSSQKDIPRSEEVKNKIKETKKLKPFVFSKKVRKKMSDIRKANPNRYWLGKKRPSMTKENNPNWKGGITTYERKLFLNANRRALVKDAKGNFTFEEWELLKRQYGYRCPACNKKEPVIKLTYDHIIPLIKGGSNYIENIQPLCKSCNCKKHTKIIKYE